MKLSASVFVFAACAAAQSPDLSALAQFIPSDLLEITPYLPSGLINDVIAGSPLPTDISSVLEQATGIPTSMIPKVTSEYGKLLSMLGSDTKPTATVESGSSKEESARSKESSSHSSGAHSESENSSKSGSKSESKSESESETSSDEGSGSAKLFGASAVMAAAAVAVAAGFF